MKGLLTKLRNVRTLPRKIVSSKNGLLATILVSTVLVVGGVIAMAPEPDKKAVQETAWPVTTTRAAPTSRSPELKLYGRVETPRQSSLTSSVMAHVDSVEVLEGSTVSKGELLISLDPTDARLSVDRAEADLTEARANLSSLDLKSRDDKAVLEHEKSLYELATAKVERHKQLRNQKSISEETLNGVMADADRQAIELRRQQGLVDDSANQLTRAKAQVKRAEAALAEAKVNLARTSIVAPFDGRITSVRVSPGELVQPGTPIVELYDTTNMEVRAQIPSSDLAAIKQAIDSGVSMPARLSTGAREIPANLARLSGEVGAGRSSVDGLFSVDARNLEIGRAVSVTLTLPPVEDTVMLPIQSLYGHNRIFVVNGDRLKAVEVERLGEVTDEAGHLNVLVRSDELGQGVPIVTS
ncbi:MAG: HlyD family secretion protein, partial [Pseudomonadales bacterium]|nr:HlyD family secretion protein [Pseudomonadales bacterium]